MRLFQGAPATADSLLYTADRRLTSFAVTACNTTGGAATVTLNVAYAGAAAAATNRVLSGVSVPANTTVIFVFPIELNQTDTLRALQATAAAVTLTIDGIDIGRPNE